MPNVSLGHAFETDIHPLGCRCHLDGLRDTGPLCLDGGLYPVETALSRKPPDGRGDVMGLEKGDENGEET